MDTFQLLSGSIGVAIGIILTKMFEILRTKSQQRRRNHSVRQMIEIEIDHNLARCKELEEKVGWKGANSPMQPMWSRAMAENLLRLPLPGLSRTILDSQLSILAEVLKKQEIEGVLKLYEQFERIEKIRFMLAQTWQAQQVKNKGRPALRSYSETMAEQREFDAYAPELWNECETIINQVRRGGNPLHSKNFNSSDFALEKLGTMLNS